MAGGTLSNLCQYNDTEGDNILEGRISVHSLQFQLVTMLKYLESKTFFVAVMRLIHDSSDYYLVEINTIAILFLI